MRRRHHDNGGNAITINVTLNDDGTLGAAYLDTAFGNVRHLSGDDRADALLQLAAAIDAELGPPLHPGTADRPVPYDADDVTNLLDACALQLRRSDTATSTQKRVAERWLTARHGTGD